mmetsp:Transcript_51109/g.150707  ORF Transcript_51109/g.150707 Transcript_51109/m.150707 type:complete len:205 (-) Transcript_51109:237-851(-)
MWAIRCSRPGGGRRCSRPGGRSTRPLIEADSWRVKRPGGQRGISFWALLFIGASVLILTGSHDGFSIFVGVSCFAAAFSPWEGAKLTAMRELPTCRPWKNLASSFTASVLTARTMAHPSFLPLLADFCAVLTLSTCWPRPQCSRYASSARSWQRQAGRPRRHNTVRHSRLPSRSCQLICENCMGRTLRGAGACACACVTAAGGA